MEVRVTIWSELLTVQVKAALQLAPADEGMNARVVIMGVLFFGLTRARVRAFVSVLFRRDARVDSVAGLVTQTYRLR